MGLGWMGISIMFCLWREITRLPALCQLSARLTRAVAKTSPRSVPAQRHRPKRRPLLSLPPHMLLSSSSLHHQSPSPTNNSLYQQLPKQTPSTPQTNPINSSQWPPFLVSRPCFQCRARATTASFLFVVIYRNSSTSPRVHHCGIHHQSTTNISSLQTSLPLSPPLSPSAPSTTTPSPSPSSAPSSATPTARPRPPTPRRSSSSPRRLPLPLPPGALPSSALPSSPTVLVPSSTQLALSPTRALPTSAP